MPDSPFLFADTASARQLTTDLATKLKDEKVAIVGGGRYGFLRPRLRGQGRG